MVSSTQPTKDRAFYEEQQELLLKQFTSEDLPFYKDIDKWQEGYEAIKTDLLVKTAKCLISTTDEDKKNSLVDLLDRGMTAIGVLEVLIRCMEDKDD